ncbi:hypothetical protein V491_00426 [Pseudogymnoascus sp. VKM F-3775]|nr:hypothetical protein V491_00426 [Pseudogymnoascus sp. VKM F-3775]
MARYRATEINSLPIEDCEPFKPFDYPTQPIQHRISDSYLGKLYASCAIFKGRRFLASEMAPITFTAKSLNIRSTGKVIGLGNAFVYDGKYVTLSGHVLRGEWTRDLEGWVERSLAGDYAAFNTLVLGTDRMLLHSITSPNNGAIGSALPPVPGPYFGVPPERFLPAGPALDPFITTASGRESPAGPIYSEFEDLAGPARGDFSGYSRTRRKSEDFGGYSPVRSTRGESEELGGYSPERSTHNEFEDLGGPIRGTSEDLGGYSLARSTHGTSEDVGGPIRGNSDDFGGYSPARPLSEELGHYPPLGDPSESDGYLGYPREPFIKLDVSSLARPDYYSPTPDRAYFSSPARPLASPSPERQYSSSPPRPPTIQRSISNSHRPFRSMHDLISGNDDDIKVESPPCNPIPDGWSGHNRVISLPNFPTTESPVASPRFILPTRNILDSEISNLIENEYGSPQGEELLVPRVEVQEGSNASMAGISDTTAERNRNFIYVPTSPSFRGQASPMSVVRSARAIDFATYADYEARDTDSANGARQVEFNNAFNDAIAATRIACRRARRALDLDVVEARIEELNRALKHIIVEEFEAIRELREQLFRNGEQSSIPE